MWSKVVSCCVAAIVLLAASIASAECKGAMLNPMSDVCWECMFPARVGVVNFGRAGDTLPGGEIDSPVCGCATGSGVVTGMRVAFWEHAYLVETVKDPWCMVALGTGMETGMNALQAGANRSLAQTGGESSYASQQVHWYKFPIWAILDLFGDFPCNDGNNFDLAYPSEVDPTWQDDSLSFILNPEALLFGNPVTQLSCMADTVATAMGDPVDPLFWCQGAWGSAYPLNGSSTVTNPNHLNASMVGRMTYKLARESLLWDTAVDKTGCSVMGDITPIWNKGHYRIQPAKPRKRNDCLPIGRSDFLWGSALNPPVGTGSQAPDNFMWIMTRARICCVGYSF